MADIEQQPELVKHHHQEAEPVVMSGEDNEYVHIGRTKVRRDELMAAFGGDLRPGLSAPPPRDLANPTPLGLFAFSMTTFVLSLCNVKARHISEPNIVVGLAYFYGGLVQLIAGIFEAIISNSFGFTALASYGGFWLSYAVLNTDAFGIAAAYADQPGALESGLGFYLMGWFIFTFLLTVCTIRSTLFFFGLFFCLTLTFLLLACAEFTGKVGVQKAGGWMGLVTALLGFYNAFAGLATRENSYITVRTIPMPGAQHIRNFREERRKRKE